MSCVLGLISEAFSAPLHITLLLRPGEEAIHNGIKFTRNTRLGNIISNVIWSSYTQLETWKAVSGFWIMSKPGTKPPSVARIMLLEDMPTRASHTKSYLPTYPTWGVMYVSGLKLPCFNVCKTRACLLKAAKTKLLPDCLTFPWKGYQFSTGITGLKFQPLPQFLI